MHKDENGKMQYDAQNFAALTLDEDIIEVTGETHHANYPRFETAIALAIGLALTAIGLAVWNQQFAKAIPLTVAVILTLFVYIKFWILRSATN